MTETDQETVAPVDDAAGTNVQPEDRPLDRPATEVPLVRDDIAEEEADGELPADEAGVSAPRRPYEGPYKESDDHVPNPYFQYAQFDTSGTGAGAADIRDLTPAFDQHRAEALGVAAEELSNHTDDAAAHVVTPQDQTVDPLAAVHGAQTDLRPGAAANPVSDQPNVGAEQQDGSVTPGPGQEESDPAGDPEGKSE